MWWWSRTGRASMSVTMSGGPLALKMHQEMATAMKRLKKMGGLKGLAGMFGGGGGGGMGGMGAGDGGLPGLGGGALPSNINDLLKK